MNTENLTPASVKAIEAGGTNNAVIGRSLVKRGIMAENPTPSGSKYILSAEYVDTEQAKEDALAMTIGAAMEKEFADTMAAEEDAAEAAGTSEEFEIRSMNETARHEEITALADEFLSCDEVRAEEITERLRELGSNPPALLPASSDAEQAFAEAVDADDMQAQAEILEGAAPIVLVRDPRETRYAHCDRWTDDNLLIKREILNRRLARRTLLRGDRMQAERHLLHVTKECEARGI